MQDPAHLANEARRQRLLAIRHEFRRRLEADTPPGRLHNKAVFYSGASPAAVAYFCAWLGQRYPACLGAVNLEALSAGYYLQSCNDELKLIFGTEEFDQRVKFPLAPGSEFSGSINGLWRELSTRYAQACSGVVHVVVAANRAQLHQASLAHWSRGRDPRVLPQELKVFGFVELPILMGLLSHNRGVSAVKIYTEQPTGGFVLLDDGLLVAGQRAGTA